MFERGALIALLLALIAGLSTLLGSFIIFFTNKKSEKLVSVALGFAAGVMLSVSFSDLLPQSMELLKQDGGQAGGVILSVILLLAGIGAALALDYFVPHQDYDESAGGKPHKNLFHMGFLSMLAIGIHNFPEGIATFMAGYQDVTLGVSIAIAISLHNIPEGITVAVPIYYATGSKGKAFKYTFMSGIAEPIGALLAYLILRPIMGPAVLGGMFAFISGIMIYIAIEELIPSSRQYGHERHALYATLAGICVMLLTHAF